MIRVLVVDDYPEVREVIREYLAGFPDEFEVVGEAADGREAVALAEVRCPDVVLMDVRMPVMDGISATRELRLRRNSAQVITYTGFALERLEVLSRLAGAACHLTKPFRLGELCQRIREVAASSRQAVAGES
ncbi:MAG: response regulator transcription factor [Acetobacteraceae bacterium]|nr:response regulator transcription factor [Acetobacteraceae bacterium]